MDGLTPEQKQRKRKTQRETILAMLQTANGKGVTAEELNKVAFRYSAIIYKLRHENGYMIDTVPRHGTECAKYVYQGHSDPGQIPLGV